MLNIETAKDVITPEDIKERLITIISNEEVKNKDACWKPSFEVGIAPSDVNYDALSSCDGQNRGCFGLKLIHTQWRYDFGFTTPSCMFTYKDLGNKSIFMVGEVAQKRKGKKAQKS